MKSSDNRRIALTALIILAVIGSCTLLIRIQAVQDLVRDGLILPLYYLFWLAGLLIRSIDQVVLWSIALIGLAMALIYGIAAARPFENPFDKPRWRESDLLPPAYGRVKFWKNRIDSLRSQGFDSDYAIHEFRRLTQAVEDISEESSEKALASVPADLKVFLEPPQRAGMDILGEPSRPWWRRWLPRSRIQVEPSSGTDSLAELTNFLEEKLEIKHDDRD